MLRFALQPPRVRAFLLLFAVITFDPARAATYTVSFDDVSETSTEAISRSRVLSVPPSLRTEDTHAGPGGLRVGEHLETLFYPNYSTPGSGRCWSRATTTDLLISGPVGSGPVSGTFYIAVDVSLTRQGGYGGNNGHGGSFELRAEVPGRALAQGSIWSGNATTSGSGVFTGYAGGDLSTVVPLTGSFPVNTLFSMTLRIEARAYTYGNGAVSPGIVFVDAGSGGPGTGGVRIGDGTGLAISLPKGFTLSSTDWNIADNRVLTSTAVGDPWAAAGHRLDVSPNPTQSTTSIGFSLARAYADATLRIHDLRGRLVRELTLGALDGGDHLLTWDGRDGHGEPVPSGVYFAVLRAGDQVARGRMVVLR